MNSLQLRQWRFHIGKLNFNVVQPVSTKCIQTSFNWINAMTAVSPHENVFYQFHSKHLNQNRPYISGSKFNRSAHFLYVGNDHRNERWLRKTGEGITLAFVLSSNNGNKSKGTRLQKLFLESVVALICSSDRSTHLECYSRIGGVLFSSERSVNWHRYASTDIAWKKTLSIPLMIVEQPSNV